MVVQGAWQQVVLCSVMYVMSDTLSASLSSPLFFLFAEGMQKLFSDPELMQMMQVMVIN